MISNNFWDKLLIVKDAGPGQLPVTIVRNDVIFFEQGVTLYELLVKFNNKDELLHMRSTWTVTQYHTSAVKIYKKFT